jgi:hypothetical protein
VIDGLVEHPGLGPVQVGAKSIDERPVVKVNGPHHSSAQTPSVGKVLLDLESFGVVPRHPLVVVPRYDFDRGGLIELYLCPILDDLYDFGGGENTPGTGAFWRILLAAGLGSEREQKNIPPPFAPSVNSQPAFMQLEDFMVKLRP